MQPSEDNLVKKLFICNVPSVSVLFSSQSPAWVLRKIDCNQLLVFAVDMEINEGKAILWKFVKTHNIPSDRYE